MKKKVIIIGAGPAGLTAAYELLKRSDMYEVVVLEESEEIGGISRTVRHHGNRMDIGGHRFFSKDEQIMQWWKERMPLQGAAAYDDKKLGREKFINPGGPDPEKEDRVMLVRQRISRIYYKKKFFDYPITMKPQTFINMGFKQTLKAGNSYLASCVHKLPEDSLENFYINRFGRVLYTMFFEGYTEKLWGRHPREIAADWGSQRVKGLSVFGILKDMFGKVLPTKNQKVETSLIEEFWYPKYGPGQLWENVADEIIKMGGKILLSSQVTSIETVEADIAEMTPNGIIGEHKGKRITAVKGKKGPAGESDFQIEADYVLSSMPLKDLVIGMGENVPREVKRVAQGLPYRDFVTVGLLVNRLKLKNKTKIPTLQNIVPDCWIYVQDTGVKLGRIQIFNNWSPYLVANPEETVWIGLEYFCTEGDAFWNMSEQECIAYAVKELIQMQILEKEGDVLDSHREQVKKAYPAYFDTYSEIDKVVDYVNEFENLFCIGRNGQHRYNNMDHSMGTAFEAVDCILHDKVDKQAVWNVNTEKEYHEKS